MGIKAMVSVMLQSRGFGKLFLYSISHKNSLVSVDKFKSKNLDSLKHLIRVSTVEKLMGTSSEEEEIWNNYKVVYKNVCKLINELKKYCSKMEKQTKTELKKSIEVYYEKKEQLEKQIEFLANMKPVNAGYLNQEGIEENKVAIANATKEFNETRKSKKYKDLLKKSECKETVMSYESFKPAEKGKDDGGAPNAPHFSEFLKIQLKTKNDELKKLNNYIDGLVAEKKKNDISKCQEKIASAASELVNFVNEGLAENDIVMTVDGAMTFLKNNGWKDDSKGTIFDCLLTSLAAKVNNIKRSFPSSKEFKDLFSNKLKGTLKITKSNFKNITIIKSQLK